MVVGRNKNFISLKYFSASQIKTLVDLAAKVKKKPGHYRKALDGKCIGLIFQKPSLRTKSAFFVGALQLGAHPVYYAPEEIKLGEREKICDAASNFSRFLDAIVMRTFSHKTILEFVCHSRIPVINGLSDLLHPSQVIGDLLTLREFKGNIKTIKVAYIGDGNNVCHSLMHAFSILGGNFIMACPGRYGPDKSILDESRKFAKISGAEIRLTRSPQEAAKNADVIYTDVWTSMGQEKEQIARKKIFKSFQVNEKLLSLAKNDCMVMHCLPAHRGEEITDSVMDSDNSVVFDQAENRLHSAKAILLSVLGDTADRR